jgi:uncharacterized protein YjlB
MEIDHHIFADDGDIPNNTLPLILYRGAIDVASGDPAVAFETLFAAHGWGGMWRDSIFDFHHYHSTAHEVLGIARGTVEVRLGGPVGKMFALHAGDAVLIPAGVGHKREEGSEDLLVIGAYPAGQEPDLMREQAKHPKEIRDRIRRLMRPGRDPVEGIGAMQRLWTG